MKGRESEDVEWGGESREERMDYQESLTSISIVTTKLQGPTNRQTDRHTDRQADRQTDRQTDTHFVPSLFDSNLNQSLSASLLLFTYCKQRAHIMGKKQI